MKHTHTADCDAHGCAYKEPAVEQETDAEGRSALKAPSDTVRPAPAAAPDAQTPPDWMYEARQVAAQCWCDKETIEIPMDTVLCEAVARRIAAWMRDAAQYARNAEYWRDQTEDLRRQLAEAETAHGVTLRRCAASERQLAAERAAREAAERGRNAALTVAGAETNFARRMKQKYERLEHERDAAADLAREKALNACLAIASTGGSAVHCVEAIRASLTDPTAVKEIINGRKDYIRLRAHLATIATGHKLLQEFDAARTARKGEEG